MIGYGRLSSLYYDLDKPAPPVAALNWYLDLAAKAGGPVLEPMCGSGRFLVPLKAAGVDIDGFDTSPSMLESCRTKLNAGGLAAKVWQSSIDDVQLPRPYGLAIIPAGSFCLLPDPERAASILFDSLGSGGKLAMEIEMVTTEQSSSWPWGGRWINTPDGSILAISWMGSYDARSQTSQSLIKYELIQNGALVETEFETMPVRRFHRKEMTDLLYRVGFDKVDVFKLYDRTSHGPNATELIFEATKR